MADQKKKGLVEGFASSVGKNVRGYFAKSSKSAASELKRGGTPSVERAGLPYSTVSQFGYDNLGEHLKIDQDLQSRFSDYEEMDEYPEISTALDIYADDATTPQMDKGDVALWATCNSKPVQTEMNEVLHRRLLVDDDVWGVTRTLAKYGQVYGELLVGDQGLVGIQYVPPPTVRRVEDPGGTLLGFIQDVRGEFNVSLEDFYQLAQGRQDGKFAGRAPGELTVFEDWEMVHWRLRGKHLRSVYGHGIIDPARWIWKRLSLLEDALLIYKLERSPARYAFYVDVGQLDAERGLAHVNRVKNNFTRKRFVNPSTGKLDMRYNPLSHDEDIFIPVRDGKRSTEIDILQGPDYSETETLEYHRDKLVSALKIPKAYMGYGGEATRNALSSEDIRFARTVMRIQQVVRSGYKHALFVHQVARGIDPNKHDFDVKMSVPSQILELGKIEVLAATADLASRMGEHVSSRWILTRLYKFTEAEAAEVMQERQVETLEQGKIDAKVQKMAMESTGTRGAPLTDGQALEMRLSKLIRAERKDWVKEFEGNRKADARLEAKLQDLLRTDGHTKKRLRELGGLVMDVRNTMRQTAPD
jgi:hypothetical protein